MDFTGGRRHSSTNSLEGDLIKTGRKLLIAKHFECNTEKSRFVIDNRLQADERGNFFKAQESVLLKRVRNWLQMYSKTLQNHWKLEQRIVVQLCQKNHEQFYQQLLK